MIECCLKIIFLVFLWSSANIHGQTTLNVTLTEFKNSLSIMDSKVLKNSTDIFQAYTNFITMAHKIGNIKTKIESAMFLAQILWESGGLNHTKELKCLVDECPGEYLTPNDYQGKNYYGRGYIQLTWYANYKAASQFLFKDDRLVKNPEMVAEQVDLAWQTSFWFWRKFVNIKAAVSKRNEFGVATKVINGGLECGKRRLNENAKKRFSIYKQVLKVFNVVEKPVEKGCD